MSIVRGPREPWINELCQDKKVLHVGCADAGLPPEGALHGKLFGVARELHGCDADPGALEALRQVFPGRYFSGLREVEEQYDLVLAPETLEHVANAGLFICDLFGVRASEYVITVPSARVILQSHLDEETGLWVEFVHPDHRAWYSPHTLLQAVLPFLDERPYVIYYLVACEMVAIRVY